MGNIFARVCNECGHIQADKSPENKELTAAFMNRKCKRCHSMSLDYGHRGYVLDNNGKIVRETYEENEE